MSINWKKCQHKSAIGNDVEYQDLQGNNQFVSIRKEGGLKKELVSKKGDPQAKFQMVDRSRDMMDISYPGYDVNVMSVPAKARKQYYLVVDHTRKVANPVLKSKFEEFYSDIKGGGKIKADKKVSQSDHSTNPDEDKRLAKKNKEVEKIK